MMGYAVSQMDGGNDEDGDNDVIMGLTEGKEGVKSPWSKVSDGDDDDDYECPSCNRELLIKTSARNMSYKMMRKYLRDGRTICSAEEEMVVKSFDDPDKDDKTIDRLMYYVHERDRDG